ncbi:MULTISPECIES: phage tail protein [Enterobacteriaceae]|uniref:phage tail protein n=1 Tax=Enterobacteriaceae TaxID=543 RepID=UPI000A07462A|nr:MULTISPECIES: phage tail protein [Enterobacteriaceae]HBY9009263.1 phage tail protein [Klebsiella pneumoniae]EBC5340254.1 phage tail protein [Salmonella enterica]EDW2144059.1 phage tail protein [Salmonella enterica subsp. enterica serovar Newport]EEK2376966.1 phage tail protein [Salmonella enterica subsp. enterica serovar Newport]EEK2422403.1 phage tail protein [Salmonella enterica subsp. enterica serovar Newport]
MSTKFYTLLTDIGAAKLASAAALGVPLKITHMAVGDGGGALPTPDAKQTALVNEKRRAALNMLYIDPQNSSQIIAEQVIPENEGGWWIREVGLFDESGALIAVGNCPESYKPQLAEGSGRTQTVRMVLITSSTDNITLKIDPAVVLATRKYVDDKALELKVYVDDLMAKHLAAPDPHSQYAPKESPTFTGTPKAPTPAAGNNTTQLATTAFVQAALTALINGAPATLDTLKEIAAAINNDPNFSTTINNVLALKAPLSSPALTGTPTAPTAAQSVNNTQIATTAFVKSAIAAMVGSAPAALDTLNELAAALGNDPNFATTMLNALAGKQPLDNTLTNLSGKDVAGLLAYLQLGEAAKRDVGTGNNQLPDMSAFGMSRNGQTAWDILPNGMIRQAGTVTLTPVGNFNAQVLGGVTYYTHYYRVNFPRQFPNAQIATLATLASSEFSKQTTMAGKSLATHRDTDSGTDVSRTRFTVAYTTPNLGETPTLHFEAIGY